MKLFERAVKNNLTDASGASTHSTAQETSNTENKIEDNVSQFIENYFHLVSGSIIKPKLIAQIRENNEEFKEKQNVVSQEQCEQIEKIENNENSKNDVLDFVDFESQLNNDFINLSCQNMDGKINL